MNRRGFLASIFKAAAAGAVSSCVRWLPMPETASIKVLKATQPGVSSAAALSDILKQYYLPAIREQLNMSKRMHEMVRLHYYQHVQALENHDPVAAAREHAEHLDFYRCEVQR